MNSKQFFRENKGEEAFIGFSETFGIFVIAAFAHKTGRKVFVDNDKFNDDCSGQMGKLQVLREWAIEFEELNSDRQWDGEFYDEADAFVEDKINGLREKYLVKSNKFGL